MTYRVIPMESCPKSSIPHQLLSSKNETRSSKKKILCPRKTNIGSYSMYLGVENALKLIQILQYGIQSWNPIFQKYVHQPIFLFIGNTHPMSLEPSTLFLQGN